LALRAWLIHAAVPATPCGVSLTDSVISVKDGKVFLNDTVQVIITDIEASNGVIHVIDSVVLPAQ
jgi:uncharacterized surface protein with fasciclin (FAS1) repeats